MSFASPCSSLHHQVPLAFGNDGQHDAGLSEIALCDPTDIHGRDTVVPRRILLHEVRSPHEVVVEIQLVSLAENAREVVEKSGSNRVRSEEHTSELQSRLHLVCRLLLEKK